MPRTESVTEVRCRRLPAMALPLAVGLVLVGAVQAADWRLTPRFSAEETFSDNIELDPDGQENSDFVTSLNGGLSLRGTGRRLNVSLDYNLQALRYKNSTEEDGINHQLQALADAELVEQVLFLEARATASQENVDRAGRRDTTNLAVTNNTTDVVTYSLTPIVRHHFGDFADAEARYSFNYVDTSAGTGSGDTQRVSARVSSGPRFSRLPWSLSATRSRISNDSGNDSRFSNLEGTVRYKFTREWGVVTSAGYESNDFQTSSGDDSGPIWSVGLTWTPTPRTSVEARYRSRFFDPGFFLSASHRARRMVFTASYDEELTTSSETFLQRQLIPLVDAFGDPIVDPITGDQVQLPVARETLTEEVQVQKSLRASASYQGRRMSSTVSVFRTISEFQLSGREDESFGLTATGSRRLSPRATLSVNGSWQRTTDTASTGDDDLWSLGTSLSYRWGRDLDTSVDVRRLTRDAPGSASDYDEHRINLRVSVDF